jgi:hypothetical protein
MERIFPVFLSGGVMAGVLFLVAPYSFLLSGFLSLAVYGGMLWLTKAISGDEIASLFQKGEEQGISESERIETIVP